MPPDLPDHQHFILNSRAYRWLLSVARMYRKLDGPKGSSMARIRSDLSQQMLDHIPDRKISRHKRSPAVRVAFELDWDLPQFIRSQGYATRDSEVLDQILCLTGTWDQAQATTVSEYMQQPWPMNDQSMLKLLHKALSVPALEFGQEVVLSSEEVGEVLGASSLSYTQRSSSCVVVAVGQQHFILEVAEQLGWVASALQPPLAIQGILGCVPLISPLQTLTERPKGFAMDAVCQIVFSYNVDDSILRGSPGFCWGALFQNPILVLGYPIPRRADSRTGLEISLPLMAELMQTQTLVKVAERFILKGFCSLAIVTRAASDAIHWHFFFNSSGERISFFDTRLDGISYEISQEQTLSGIGGGRHIIGWCCDVKDHLGKYTANWMIESSRLPPNPGSIVIDRLYLEGGSQVVGGISVAIGKKDKPVRLQRNKSFSGMLEWISRQPIVFYDVGDRRAWLGDGASALLHLVRASIDRDRDQPAYRSKWKFDGKLEEDSSDAVGTTSAVEILGNFNNLNRELYLDDIRPNESGQLVKVYYRFRDRVQEILNDIQVLVDYQSQLSAQDGYWIRQSGKLFSKSITGFDFWDVAKPSAPIQQRAHHLETWGHGWVDYIRSAKATIIFGRGFGDLLQADNPALLCPGWKTIPKGQDFMGSSIATLKRLQDHNGGLFITSGQISSDIVWSSRDELFTRCKCASLPSGSTMCHLDPVQLLLPPGNSRLLDIPKNRKNVNLSVLTDTGAVIFGHTPYIMGPRKSDSQPLIQSNGQATTGSTSYTSTQESNVFSAASSSGTPALSPLSSSQKPEDRSTTDTSWDSSESTGRKRRRMSLWPRNFRGNS